MKKILYVLVLVSLVLTIITIPTFAQDTIKVTVNGEKVDFPDMNPVIMIDYFLVNSSIYFLLS